MTISTLDPAYQASTNVLSGGNLVATCHNGGSPCGGLGTPELTATTGTGKWYWEAIMTGGDNAAICQTIATTSVNLNSPLDSGTFGINFNQTGHWAYNGSDITTNTAQSWGLGDHLQIAVDLVNKRMWYKVNNGSWNNDPSRDPATNVGGQDISALLAVSGNIRPGFQFATTGTTQTINFGGSAFYGSVPAGFQAAETWSATSFLAVQQRATAGTPYGSATWVPSITFPNAPTNGNLLYSIIWAYNTTLTAASGWTQDVAYNNGGSHCAAFYKYAGAGESATQTPVTNSEQNVGIVMFEVSGVTGVWGTDHVASGGSVTDGSSVSGGTVSYTTSVNNELVLSGWVGNSGATTLGSGGLSASTVYSQYNNLGGPSGWLMMAVAGELYVPVSGTAVTDNFSYTTPVVLSNIYARFQSGPPPMTLDGSATSIASGVTSATVSLTTTKPNDVVVVIVSAEGVTTMPYCTGVTASGLTFSKRGEVRGNPNCYMGVFWAPAAAVQSGTTITVSMSSGVDDMTLIAFGVNGCYNINAPWDDNANLPVFSSALGLVSTNDQYLGDVCITRSSPVSFAFGATMTNSSTGAPNTIKTFQHLAGVVNTGGAYDCLTNSYYNVVGAPLPFSYPGMTGERQNLRYGDCLSGSPPGTAQYPVTLKNAGTGADSTGGTTITKSMDLAAESVVVFVFTNASGSATSITSITSTNGLTFTERYNSSSCGLFSVWWAPVTSALSQETITVTCNAAINGYCVDIFNFVGVSLTSPFDSNGSLPAATVDSTAAADPMYAITSSSSFAFGVGSQNDYHTDLESSYSWQSMGGDFTSQSTNVAMAAYGLPQGAPVTSRPAPLSRPNMNNRYVDALKLKPTGLVAYSQILLAAL